MFSFLAHPRGHAISEEIRERLPQGEVHSKCIKFNPALHIKARAIYALSISSRESAHCSRLSGQWPPKKIASPSSRTGSIRFALSIQVLCSSFRNSERHEHSFPVTYSSGQTPPHNVYH